MVGAGNIDKAVRTAERALAGAKDIQELSDRALALARVTGAFSVAGAEVQAIEALAKAFMTARRVDRIAVFDVLECSASKLASIDRGETLRRVCEVVREVDAWWS